MSHDTLLADVRCPLCKARIEVQPGRICCPACDGRFDVVPVAPVGGSPFRTAHRSWKAIAGTLPPAGVVDSSGGPLLRSVKIGGEGRRTVWSAVVGGSLTLIAGFMGMVAGSLPGQIHGLVIGLVVAILGLRWLIIGMRGRRIWVGEVIHVTREALRVETIGPYGVSIAEVPLAAVARVDDPDGRSVVVRISGRLLPLMIADGWDAERIDWLAHHLQDGLALGRWLTAR